jgi:hypothetical protein
MKAPVSAMPKMLFLEKTAGDLTGVRAEGFEITDAERKSLQLELTHSWHTAVMEMFARQERPKGTFDVGIRTLSTKIEALNGVDFEVKAKIDGADPRQYELYMTWLPPRRPIKPQGPDQEPITLRDVKPVLLTPRERHCLGCVIEEMEGIEAKSPGASKALTMLAYLALAETTAIQGKLDGAEIYRHAARAIVHELEHRSVSGSPNGEPGSAEFASVLTKTEAFGLWLSIYRRYFLNNSADLCP